MSLASVTSDPALLTLVLIVRLATRIVDWAVPNHRHTRREQGGGDDGKKQSFHGIGLVDGSFSDLTFRPYSYLYITIFDGKSQPIASTTQHDHNKQHISPSTKTNKHLQLRT